MPTRMFQDSFIATHPDIKGFFESHYSNLLSHLSDLDIAFAVIHYPYPPGKGDPEWSLSRALDVARVDETTKTELIELWEDARDRTDTLRRKFAAWWQKSIRSSLTLPKGC